MDGISVNLKKKCLMLLVNIEQVDVLEDKLNEACTFFLNEDYKGMYPQYDLDVCLITVHFYCEITEDTKELLTQFQTNAAPLNIRLHAQRKTK